MTVIEPTLPVVRGLVDRDGRLVEADAPLEEVNARAGGRLGGALTIPAIAHLVRLAGQLRTTISRSARMADGDQDVEAWVRVSPEDGSVRIEITNWRSRPAGGALGDAVEAWQCPAAAEAEWRWETDAALHLTYVAVAPDVHDGRDLAALLGQPLTRLFAIDMADPEPPILRALSLHQRFDGQAAVVRASGRAVQLEGMPRRDGAGRFAGFAGAARYDRGGDAAPAFGDGAFNTRLDSALRGPLGAIIANADAIQAQNDGALAGTYAEYAGDIATAGRHLLGLVDDLVDLQAIERSDFHVAAEAIDLADLARRAAGLLQVRASAKQVRIDRPAAGENLPASGEFRRVLQILVNLIGNAVRYSPEGSVVWVRAERIAGEAAVIVADQGKGIAPEDQARIFEKFARVDPNEPGGSGLGLYISRRLARAMAGDIAVDSAPGQGARFTLTLPSRG